MINKGNIKRKQYKKEIRTYLFFEYFADLS